MFPVLVFLNFITFAVICVEKCSFRAIAVAVLQANPL
jgi:hypothetical protein